MIFTGGRLDRFCAMGADANAETSMTGTTYYVTGGNEFIHAFGDLIGMVARPRFGEDELKRSGISSCAKRATMTTCSQREETP